MFRGHWNTTVAIVVAGFLIFLGVGVGVFESDQSAGERTLFIGVFGLAGIALLCGLWLLAHSSRTALAYTLIVIGSLAAAVWWWMVLPTILALVVLISGVLRGGLARELRRA
jgi:hypothetical protein